MQTRTCPKCNKKDYTDFSKCRYCSAHYGTVQGDANDELIQKISRYAFWPIVIAIIAGLWANRGIIGDNVNDAVAHRPKPMLDALTEFAGATDSDPRTKQALKDLRAFEEDSEAKGHKPTKEEITQFLQSKGYQ
jgi:hypothetical protein